MSNEENQICPKCKSPYGYPDGNMFVCPECFHEWSPSASSTDGESVTTDEALKYVDANGNKLETGDTVVTVKDLKVGKDTIKSGTKVKNIRLLDEMVDGHDISCKIDGYGALYLKCSVVKKFK